MVKLQVNIRHWAGSTWEKTKLRATSLESWKLPKQASSLAPEHVWSNADQDPVEPYRRTWTSLSFAGYWFSDLWTIQGWQAISSCLLVGLSSTDAILLILVAGLCNAIPTVLNGAMGANLHIAFPVASRSSFGYRFSYFVVFSRAILALFWFGITAYAGASAMSTMLTAIWPSFATIPNHLPASAGITTASMTAYLLYSILQAPLLLIPTERLQYMFLAKAVLVPPMVLAMVIWTCVKAKTGGSELFSQPATVSGSAKAWIWLSTMTSITGGWATLPVNIADFSRFSKTPQAQWWQLFIIPTIKIITALCGLACTGASKYIYGEYVWSPLTIVASWCDTPGGRFAAFVASAIWLLAQLSCNISANAVSFSNDITTLAPKWFNLRRGSIFAMIFGGWALVPWKILASATTFLSFMSGYSIFMAPFAGILCCDYWIVKKRHIDVPALFDPHGRYMFNKFGTNWRAVLILLVIIPPLFPGLARSIKPSAVHVSQGILHLYSFNWLFGFCTSVALYWILDRVFPAEETYVTKTIHGLHDLDELPSIIGQDELKKADDDEHNPTRSVHSQEKDSTLA